MSQGAGTKASKEKALDPKSRGTSDPRGGAVALGSGVGSRAPICRGREASRIPGPWSARGPREGALDRTAPAPLPGKFQV